jgi:hypothetical protein
MDKNQFITTYLLHTLSVLAPKLVEAGQAPNVSELNDWIFSFTEDAWNRYEALVRQTPTLQKGGFFIPPGTLKAG